MTTFQPKAKRELLAYTIAETFNDSDHLQLYLTYCKKYATHIIQRAYAEAHSIPQERIKKSRAAVFFYLIKQYAHKPQTQNNQQSEHYPGY
ncbi:MAG TPA: hypothetical protein VFC63_11115 [Blastocatellia bacterium]|nr:hypothetical protein [Blastocatellia bacterium]